MNKWVLIILAAAAAFAYQKMQPAKQDTVQSVQIEAANLADNTSPTAPKAKKQSRQRGAADGSFEQVLQQAFEQHQSDIQVEGEGVVKKTLPDDNKGTRHQRFILQLSDGQTLLFAHNIDLADKIKGLKKGDTVRFYGEYEWSEQGGVIHWTHHDPSGRHEDGWLEHDGKRYQ